MIGPLLFVVVLSASGVIAFLGDYIGRKVGKKRLSHFGMRPRNFAVLVSISSGVIVSLFTLTVLTAVSPTARQALFGLEKIKKEKRATEQKLIRKEAEVGKFEQELKVKRESFDVLSHELKEITVEYEKIGKEIAGERQRLKRARVELTQALASKKRTAKELSLRKKSLTKAQQEIELLSKHIADLQEKRNRLSERIEDLRKQGNDVFQRLADAQKKLAEIQKEKQHISTAFEEIRKGKVILAAKEPLGYVIFPKHTSRKTAEEKMMNSLVKLEQVVQARGAGKDKNGKSILIYEREFIQALRQVTNKDYPTFLRILSAGNVIAGEPVRIMLQIGKNTKLLSAGETLSTLEILPSLEREKIESKLIQLMRNAERKAHSLGLLSEADFKTLTPKEFIFLVDQILKSEVTLVVNAELTQDLYVSGPLVLWIDVREKK